MNRIKWVVPIVMRATHSANDRAMPLRMASSRGDPVHPVHPVAIQFRVVGVFRGFHFRDQAQRYQPPPTRARSRAFSWKATITASSPLRPESCTFCIAANMRW